MDNLDPEFHRQSRKVALAQKIFYCIHVFLGYRPVPDEFIGYILQALLGEVRGLPDTDLHSPDIVVPHWVDLGHLTEAADHGQVNHRQNSLKILDQNSNHLGESEQGLVEQMVSLQQSLSLSWLL